MTFYPLNHRPTADEYLHSSEYYIFIIPNKYNYSITPPSHLIRAGSPAIRFVYEILSFRKIVHTQNRRAYLIEIYFVSMNYTHTF